MTYLHDPDRRAARRCTESRGREVPRQRGAAPYAGGSREEPVRRAPDGVGAETAGFPSSPCSDCNLGFGRHVHLHLRSVAAEVGRARATAGAALASWGCPPEAVDDGRLLVSELVGNAIRHAPGTWITLDLMQLGDRLLVEVTDGSTAQPVVHRADPEQEQGRGMYLVQAIASAWGARREGRGRKTTWCTLAIGGSAEARPPG